MIVSFNGLELDVRYTPGDAGEYGGPPERWRAPEGAEVEINSVGIEDRDEWNEFVEDYGVSGDIAVWLIENEYDAICEECKSKKEREHAYDS